MHRGMTETCRTVLLDMSNEPIAFRMQLKPGCICEYERRHKEIWPDLTRALTEAGVYDYSIFLDDETLMLFAVLRLRDDHQRDALAQHPVMRQWWSHMAELMIVQPDNRPVEWPLRRVFRLRDAEIGS